MSRVEVLDRLIAKELRADLGGAVIIGGHHRVGVGAVQEGAGAADRETLLARLMDVAPGQQRKT